jgi:hypothetical protein
MDGITRRLCVCIVVNSLKCNKCGTEKQKLHDEETKDIILKILLRLLSKAAIIPSLSNVNTTSQNAKNVLLPLYAE